MSFFQKLCPAHFHLVSCSFCKPHPDTQCCIYNLLVGQPENSCPFGWKYCIIFNPPGDSGLHIPCFLQHVSESARTYDRNTMPARSPCVGDIPSRAIGLPETMFATLEVSPTGHLGPNTYHTSPKAVNIPLIQISTPLLLNICCLLPLCP